MESVLQLLTVFGLGAIELWLAVPVGFAMGIGPVATALVSFVGALFGVVVVLVSGERIRAWLVQRHDRKGKDRKPSHIYRIWARYGVVGLGLLAPLVTGAPLGTAIGIAFDIPRRRLLLWISVGIILWTAGLTVAGALGLVFTRGLTP